MDLLLALLGTLIQLAVFGAVVFLIVRVVSRRDRGPTEGAGTSIRRFFLYALMLVTLTLSGIGLGGLLDAVASAGAQITRDSTAVARALAFTLVGVPVYAGLAIYAARRLRDDPRERESLGWTVYLTATLIASLVTAMSLAIAFLTEALSQARIDRLVAIHLVIWSGVWASHWLIARRWAPRNGASVHLLLGSVVGLMATVIGTGTFIIVVFQAVYDSLFLSVAVGRGTDALVQPLIIAAVGVPAWWWYWLRHSLRADRTTLWVTYVLLVGVLGGVVGTVSGAGMLLYSVLQWLIGDPATTSAAAQFASLPDALGAVVVGGAVWSYHASVLGERSDRSRTEVDRVHDYLLAATGLVVGASGVAILITVMLDAVGGRDLTTTSDNTIVAALTLLLVGGPLWWRYWSAASRARREDPEGELASTSRRIYVFVLLGLAALVAVVDLIVILFLVFEDVLDGTLGRGTFGDVSVAVGLLVTAGAVAWYHFAVFREDRADAPQEAAPALRDVTVVGANIDDLATGVTERTGARVHLLRSSRPPTPIESADDLLDALGSETHERVVVIARGDDRFDVVILDE
jgi:hypothetical protein